MTDQLPSPSKDGIDHINVYSKGRTSLGQFSSNFAYAPFTCEDGKFNCVEGYWYWLSVPDDRLRIAIGYSAKKLGRELRGENSLDTPEFRRKIEAAIRAKFAAYPEYLRALKENDLPLVHYYVINGKAKYAGYEWVIDILRKIASET